MSKAKITIEIEDDGNGVNLAVNASPQDMQEMFNMDIVPESLLDTISEVCEIYIENWSMPAFVGIIAKDMTLAHDKTGAPLIDHIDYDWKFMGEDFFLNYCKMTGFDKDYKQWVEQMKHFMGKQVEELQKMEDEMPPRKITI